MRKVILAAIMAASALVPAAAFAQDDNGRPAWRGARGDRGADRGAQQQRAERPQAPQQVQQQPAPQQQQRVARPDRGNRPDLQAGPPLRSGGFPGQPAFQRSQTPQPDVQRNDRGGNPALGGRQDWQARGDNRFGGNPALQGGQRQRSDPVARDRDRRDERTDNRAGNRWNNNNDRGSAGNRDDRNRDGRNWNGNRDRNDGGWNGNTGWNGGRDRNDGRGWSRNWRQDRQYDYSSYRNQNRNAFHLPRYYAPYGWDGGYRRFGIGFTLSSILFNQDYWIDDADYYRLPPAYGPYRWVRYYNDALLVDVRTGYVVDTVYDIFW